MKELEARLQKLGNYRYTTEAAGGKRRADSGAVRHRSNQKAAVRLRLLPGEVDGRRNR